MRGEDERPNRRSDQRPEERSDQPPRAWPPAVPASEPNVLREYALLLPGIRGALPGGDPRTEATRQAVLAELGRDGYLYRFRPDVRPLGDAEGAFLLCGFAAALAAWQAGDPVAATRWFERNRAACGAPGLFTEEYDVQQRQLRANLPQAFVHALMLETAVTVGQATPGPTHPANRSGTG